MEKFLEKFNNKKMIENSVIFLILAIIVMIVINSLFDTTTEEKSDLQANSIQILNRSEDNTLEAKLANILSKIDGAGNVDVMVSYTNEIEKIPMLDVKTTTTIINEKDSGGGERKTEETSTEENIIYEENGNSKTPVIKQKILPEIIGVIVVAEGANNITVRENLIKAVEATINVSSHRIQVFSK